MRALCACHQASNAAWTASLLGGQARVLLGGGFEVLTPGQFRPEVAIIPFGLSLSKPSLPFDRIGPNDEEIQRIQAVRGK